MRDFDDERERRPARTAPAPSEASQPAGLASAIGNQGMQRLAASPEAERVGPAGLAGSGALARAAKPEDEETAAEPAAQEEPTGDSDTDPAGLLEEDEAV